MIDANQEQLFERNKDIQAMINAFLNGNHMATITEIMAKDGKCEIEGVLTPIHKIALQQMIKQRYPNIDEMIRSDQNRVDGHGQILGVLSSTESSLIDNLLDDFRLVRATLSNPHEEVKYY